MHIVDVCHINISLSSSSSPPRVIFYKLDSIPIELNTCTTIIKLSDVNIGSTGNGEGSVLLAVYGHD